MLNIAQSQRLILTMNLNLPNHNIMSNSLRLLAMLKVLLKLRQTYSNNRIFHSLNHNFKIR
jgi:hypothetical protein